MKINVKRVIDMGDSIESITSKFQEVHGSGDGLVSPPYNIETVPIVLQETEKGFLVHQPVGSILDRVSTVWGGGAGTGYMKGDAVVYYSSEDFKEEIGDEFVTIDRYKRDMAGMEAGTVANDKLFLVNDLTVMKDRVEEIGKDVAAYEENLNAEIQDLQQRQSTGFGLGAPSN